ncbi:MAG: SUMF1/EgtB/PvdO family nonheme iron enzyme [Desulfomonile sp.]|nr:SUMF1/EgtB/PvdO family nonheme iron enzyme [Deltaproteobacteria bacterium]
MQVRKTYTGILRDAVCIVAIFTCAGTPLAGESSLLLSDAMQLRLASKIVSAYNLLDCPLLPGCPSGPSVPLPPTFDDQRESVLPAYSPDNSKVAEGKGNYSEMLFIPSGSFDMGSKEGEGRVDERPRHKVFLKDFYVAKHEITVRQFCDFLNNEGESSKDGIPRVKLDNPDCPLVRKGRVFRPKPGFEDKPVVCVSWYGAVDYALWAGGRLPTSAEWEKVALLTTLHVPTDNLKVSAEVDSEPVFSAVRGVRDIKGMIGNVWEWCSDWYLWDYYTESPAENPEGPSVGTEKIIRGGSWASPDALRRIQNRHRASPRGYYRTVGFRIVKD